ncbi:alpha/beta fold hydrolase [Phenylobacterium sp. J367]|uniref:alpha/beta fold hydrolase n=1 Tax=Phenylobacterium sp. J367 TaxID=2898435 RepID=UPI0021518AB3|nr:alpha/beta hydrolase [Phenylobacterium sp. J367]MCR5880596.1 alpha/beta hydrolase [Phenylobacterium sp. J367]
MRGLVVLLLVLAFAGGAEAQGPASRFLTVSDGTRIHYLEAGSGPAVILLHGSTGTAESNYVTTGILQALAANHRVIAPDFRGQGKSQRSLDPRRYASDRFPQDVLEIMDQLDVRKAHVAGYSMGGEMLAPLLAIAPDRILTATFGGSGLLEPDRTRDAAAMAKDVRGRDEDPPAGARRLWVERSPDALRAMEQGRRAQPPTTPPLDLRKVTFPVLAVVGEYDTPNRFTSLMARTLPDFRLVVLKGRGHATALADPAYKEALVEFIGANDP